MKQAVIFDLDGTLVDSCGICLDIIEAMLIDRGFDRKIVPVDARPLMSRGGQSMVSTLLGQAGRDPSSDLAEFRERYSCTTTPVDALFDGVATGLQALSGKGFKLAICSNKPQSLCELAIRDTGIADHFLAVVGGTPGLAPKPAPDLLDATLAQLGLRAEACIYVGDSELDHAVAERAGMPFHFLTYGYAHPGWSPTASTVHDDFTSLTRALLSQRPVDLAA